MADLSTDPTPAEAMAQQSQSKKKSKKRNFVPLDDYLPSATRTTSWADEEVVLPTAPSSREEPRPNDIGGFYANQGSNKQRSHQSRRDVPIPDRPPFTAYVGNLPFNTTEKDLAEFFQMKIISSRFPTHKDNDRPKGFGYIEFDSKKDLEKALTFHERELKDRRLKIDLADQNEDKTTGDWRGGDRKPSGENKRFGGRSTTSGDDVDDWRGGDRKQPSRDTRRSGPERSVSAGDDVDDWRIVPRKKPEGRRDDRDHKDRRSHADRRNFSDDGSDSWRERKAGEGPTTFKKRDDSDRGERDNKWGSRRGNTRDQPESLSSGSSDNKERKKLNLKPRSADPKEIAHEIDSTYTTKAKVNPFGAAKPRDEEAALKKIEVERKKRHEEEESKKETLEEKKN